MMKPMNSASIIIPVNFVYYSMIFGQCFLNPAMNFNEKFSTGFLLRSLKVYAVCYLSYNYLFKLLTKLIFAPYEKQVRFS